MTFLPDVVKQMFDHMSVHSWIQESVEGFVYSEIRQHVLKNTEMIRPSPRLVSLTLTTAVCVKLPDRWTDGGTPRANAEMLWSMSLPGRDLTSVSVRCDWISLFVENCRHIINSSKTGWRLFEKESPPRRRRARRWHFLSGTSLIPSMKRSGWLALRRSQLWSDCSYHCSDKLDDSGDLSLF